MSRTVSLETAKKLNEAGWPQEGAQFYQVNIGQGDQFPRWVVSPTTDELLDALPITVRHQLSHAEKSGYDGWRDYTFTFGKTHSDTQRYYAMYADPHPANKYPIYAGGGDTPAEALAALWLELRAKNLI